jgi:hypothetical protein
VVPPAFALSEVDLKGQTEPKGLGRANGRTRLPYGECYLYGSNVPGWSRVAEWMATGPPTASHRPAAL